MIGPYESLTRRRNAVDLPERPARRLLLRRGVVKMVLPCKRKSPRRARLSCPSAFAARWVSRQAIHSTPVSSRGVLPLTPRSRRPPRARIVKDPVTGLPVLTAGSHAPGLTHKQVQQILADFP